MPVTIRCTLLRDTFEGGRHDNPRVAEWPPSWMRLFSALVSVAAGEQDDPLLHRLESAAAPEIHAPRTVAPTHRFAFVPTNRTQTTQHTTLVGRTNSERGWARVAVPSRQVWYRWPDLDLDPDDAAALAALCRRVPYLGRATCPAVVEVIEEEPPHGAPLIPVSASAGDATFRYETSVRCPYPGALAALRDAYEAKHRHGRAGDPWQVGLDVEYGRDRPVQRDDVVAGPYGAVVVLALEGRRLDGRHAVRVTHAVRRAVLSRASAHLPILHGHHGGQVVQCAFLALPFVGHPGSPRAQHADGHLLGVAVALPDIPPEELAVVAGALPAAGDSMEATAGPLGIVTLRRLSPLDTTRRPWALQPQRWEGPSERWVTALPMVFDRYLKRGDDPVEQARQAAVNSKLPRPAELRLSRRPLVAGAVDMAPRDTVRRRSDRGFKPYRHVALRFPARVRGPVVVGSMRHYGLGLCVPLGDEGGDDD